MRELLAFLALVLSTGCVTNTGATRYPGGNPGATGVSLPPPVSSPPPGPSAVDEEWEPPAPASR